jgi:outer membrane protein TolC
MKHSLLLVPVVVMLQVAVLSGCMSAKAHRKKADEAATDIISEYQQEALGRTEPFTIEEPADSLRRRLMITQDLPGHVSGITSNELFRSDSPLKITLLDAMQFAARSSREYQAQKESVFSVALDLDLSRASFRNSYSALLSSLFSGSGSGDSESRSVKGEASGGITRKFQTGATLSSKLGLDIVKLLTMDKTSTFGIFADATVSIPLLSGAGRSIARESLTQAERNVIYAIWAFERYKKTFAVDVASSYLGMLELQKQIQNAEANYKSIVATREREEALADAGRTSQTQVDQASQNELQASNSLVVSRQSLEAQLDAFKVKLGIPVDARIELEATDLVNLSDEILEKLSEEPTISTEAADKLASEYVQVALSNRLDLITVRHGYEDARRVLKIAEDALDPEMTLALSASTRKTEISGGTTAVSEGENDESSSSDGESSFSDNFSYSAALNLDLPWDKTTERAAFRRSLIALRSAERSIEEKEDGVKQELRSAARKIQELKKTYLIQQEAVKLAERRVESTDLFLQAGKVPIRDLLEAQEDLVQAQDSLVSAVVDYHLATLELQKALERLEVDEKGLWRQNEE